MNSDSLSDNTCDRMIRMEPIALNSARAQITTVIVNPNATAIVMTMTSPGSTSSVSTNRCRIRSNSPPKYALAIPIRVPTATPMRGDRKPTNRDTRPP